MWRAADKGGALVETGVRLAHILGEEWDMTKALAKVFKEASKLSEAEQDALAEAIRAELGAEKDWDRSFASSLDVLERLADEAIAEHRAGRTTPIDPDKM